MSTDGDVESTGPERIWPERRKVPKVLTWKRRSPSTSYILSWSESKPRGRGVQGEVEGAKVDLLSRS
jgi:hypothetical protein